MLRRFALAATVIVLASAAATAFVGLTSLDALISAFGGHNPLDLGSSLTRAKPGAPQTILLIGSDRRAPSARDADQGAHSDTMILVRIDPSQPATAVWSLPRDLQVPIPGHGIDKLNAAYFFGGDALTLETVRELTGLEINHVIDVNFGGFRRAVDEIGCVYTDVDQRYLNDNSDGTDSYATIDIQPGYQKLCGQQALDYVRYRHTDSDIVREARQQSFLRQAESQTGVSGLLANQQGLSKIFSQETQSDLAGTTDALRLVNEAFAARSKPLRTVSFEGDLGPSFVYSRTDQVQDMAARFLSGARPVLPAQVPPPQQPIAAGAQTPISRSRTRQAQNPVPPPAPSDLQAAPQSGREQALSAVGAQLRIYYPTALSAGSHFERSARVYTVAGPDNHPYPSYRMVVATGRPGENYGIQGTTWPDPPLLRAPSTQRTIDGRTYQLYYAGNGLSYVSWRDGGAVYWVSNTLVQSLSENQMLAIAASTRPL